MDLNDTDQTSVFTFTVHCHFQKTKPKHNPVIYSELLSFEKRHKSTSWSRYSSLLQTKIFCRGSFGRRSTTQGREEACCLFFFLFLFFTVHTCKNTPRFSKYVMEATLGSFGEWRLLPPSTSAHFTVGTKCDDASDTIKPTNMTVLVKMFLTKE